MSFNHICIIVSDLDRSLPFYKDLLGFKKVLLDTTEPGNLFNSSILDDILGVKDAATRIVVVADEDGATLELQQAANPHSTKAPDEYLSYGRTGLKELAIDVPDIDDLFQRVKAAGIKVQTDYIWSPYAGTRSFLFYDPDGALIQAMEVTAEQYPR